MDTIRMIAYQSETAMALLLKEQGMEMAQTRRILQYLYLSEIDIEVDISNNILEIRVHRSNRPAVDRALEFL